MPENTTPKMQQETPTDPQSRPNVDASEIAKFDALASRWWDPAGEFRPLHEINPLRLNWIREHVDLDGQTVIDIGCGGGILTEAMAAAGGKVSGIDMAEAPLAVARLHQLESGVDVDYRQATAEEIVAEAAGRFDVVTCLEMLEHVPSPAAVIRSVAELLRPGGHAFFSTINRNPKSFLFAPTTTPSRPTTEVSRRVPASERREIRYPANSCCAGRAPCARPTGESPRHP